MMRLSRVTTSVLSVMFFAVLGRPAFAVTENEGLSEGSRPTSRAVFVARPLGRPLSLPESGIPGARLPARAAGSRGVPANVSAQEPARAVQAASANGGDARQTSEQAFDGAPASGDGGAVNGNGGDGGAGNGGGGGPTDGGSNGQGNNGHPLNHLYPRVVFLQDVFPTPASEKTVEYIERLLDEGVHVVFLTHRPQRGVDSADSVLLSRLRYRRTNPILVVSHNGGKISLHSKAEEPASLIEDVGYFPEGVTDKLYTAAHAVEAELRLKPGTLAPLEIPKSQNAFSFFLNIGSAIKDKDVLSFRHRAVRRLNALLQRKDPGCQYRFEAYPGKDRLIAVHAMPLRFSLPRVYKVLDDQFKGEGLLQNTDKFLIIADSMKSPRFSMAFPKDAEVQVVTEADEYGGDAVAAVLGAVLGERTLPTVKLKLGMLRQFVEFWEPTRRFRGEGSDDEGGGGGGGLRSAPSDRALDKEWAMFSGSVVFKLMAMFYQQLWKHNHKVNYPWLETKLKDFFFLPFKNGINVKKGLTSMKSVVGTTEWKRKQLEAFLYTKAFISNFYAREFRDFSGAARDAEQNLVRLATDRSSRITVDFVSSSTGKVYRIYTRIPRMMRHYTAEGLVLTAYGYRSGKEGQSDGDNLYAKILAIAMLKADGRPGADGLWHYGAPDADAISKLNVQFEYRSTHRTWSFKPEEFLKLENVKTGASRGGSYMIVQGPAAQEITSTIERMMADEEYRAYYEENEQEATEADMKTSKKAPGKKKPAKGAKKDKKSSAKARRA